MAEKEIKGLNWQQILITSVVTGIVGVTTGMLLFHLQQRQPQLSYTLSDSLSFMGDKERLAIHNIVIRNGGKAIVKNVDCSISVSPAIIKEKRISADPSLKFTDSVKGNSYSLHIDNINPDEKIALSLLSTSKNETPLRPVVSLRGEGFIGKESSDAGKKSILDSPILPALVSAYAAAIALYVLLRFRRRVSADKASGFKDDSSHEEDQNKILSYLFGLVGLTSEVDSYLQKAHDSSYWSEADRIASATTKISDSKEIEARKQVLINLLKYAVIAPESQGIIHYNIARIAKVQNRNGESDAHLAEARKHIPKLLDKRLQLDPIFNSESGKDA